MKFKKNILFTGYYFNMFTGSMMHICEVGKYFRDLGYDVYIASVYINPKIEQYCNSLGLVLKNAGDIPMDITYDIVWSYHFPILPYLLGKGLKYKKVVTGYLSGILHPLETPQYFSFCHDIPSFVNSEETKMKIIERFPELESKISVLPNIVPEIFLQNKKDNLSKELKSIAIVSNHIPPELSEIIEPLKIMNISTDVYGGKNNVIITPEVLKKYDVIISIGKTVYYALVMGIPVFNYDHFGGAGYINTENIYNEEFYNFSGRSCRRQLKYDDIICELIAYYKQTCEQVDALQKIAVQRYLISNIMPVILEKIDNSPDLYIDNELEKLYIAQNKFLVNEIDCLMQRNKPVQNTTHQRPNFNFFREIFSVRNDYSKDIKIKVITLFGIKIKLKVKS